MSAFYIKNTFYLRFSDFKVCRNLFAARLKV